MELAQLEACVAIAEHGSFLAAAQAVGVRRSSLRSRVDALEAELGTRLLVRTHQGVELTEAGQRLVERARRLLREAEALRHLDAVDDDALAGELDIVLPQGVHPAMPALFTARIRQLHPGVRLHIAFGSEAWPSEADLVLQFGDLMPRGQWRTMVIARFSAVLMATTDYLDARGRPSDVRELADHDLVSWVLPGEDGRTWPLRDGGRLPVTPALSTSDAHLARTLAEHGNGVALVPHHAGLDAMVQDGVRLEPVLADVVGTEVTLRVLIPERQVDSPRVRLAIRVATQLRDDATALGG